MCKTGGHPLTQNRRIIGRLINGTIQIENFIYPKTLKVKTNWEKAWSLHTEKD